MFGVIVYTERLVLSKIFLFFDVKPFAITFFARWQKQLFWFFSVGFRVGKKTNVLFVWLVF